VCYGVGEELTVTDANLLLGRLDPDLFFGGRMALDLPRAEAVARDLAKRLKLRRRRACGKASSVSPTRTWSARFVSCPVERGHDPRRFALVAFGGAGGMHACEIAKTLEIDTVIVPRYAGVLSALGMLVADVTRDYSASVLAPGESSFQATT
jgi:N-methylhydantoinase A/oxoprolinase/acetone carboxylase beta subunit